MSEPTKSPKVSQPALSTYDIDLVERWTGTYDADSVAGYYPAVKKLVSFARVTLSAGPAPKADLKALRAAREHLDHRIHAAELNAIAQKVREISPTAVFLAATTSSEDPNIFAYMLMNSGKEKVETDEWLLDSILEDKSFTLLPDKYEKEQSPLRGCTASFPLLPADTFVYELTKMDDATAESLENLPNEWPQ